MIESERNSPEDLVPLPFESQFIYSHSRIYLWDPLVGDGLLTLKSKTKQEDQLYPSSTLTGKRKFHFHENKSTSRKTSHKRHKRLIVIHIPSSTLGPSFDPGEDTNYTVRWRRRIRRSSPVQLHHYVITRELPSSQSVSHLPLHTSTWWSPPPITPLVISNPTGR